MATSKDDILKAIEDMSVMELVELISDIEEKFGVTAAAAVAAAPGSSNENANNEGPNNTSSEHPKSVPSKANLASEFLIT